MWRIRHQSSAAYRFKIKVKVTVGRAKSIADTRETFWSAYRAEASELGESRNYAWYEQRVRSNFPACLQSHLRREIPDVAIVFSALGYGSLDIGLTAISAGFAALGLTVDDARQLVQQYVPLAFAEALESTGADLDFGTQMESEAYAPTPAPAAAKSTSGDLSWLAGVALALLPALILVWGAYTLFRSASAVQHDAYVHALDERKSLTEAVVAERGRLTDALISERAALAEERKARVTELAARTKALEGQIADMNARWGQLLVELQKVRAKPATDGKPTRRR